MGVCIGYMKTVKAKLAEGGASADTIKQFETGAQTFAKKVVTSFKDWDFYTGENMDPHGMYVLLYSAVCWVLRVLWCLLLTTGENRVALLNYREDGSTPYMCFWKHGLKEEKV